MIASEFGASRGFCEFVIKFHIGLHPNMIRLAVGDPSGGSNAIGAAGRSAADGTPGYDCRGQRDYSSCKKCGL